MYISLICPAHNEANYIENVIKFYQSNSSYECELIIVDGNSTDSTVNIVKQYSIIDNNIILLHNPKKYVSFALNEAIKIARGEIIIRIDAHSFYSPDYVGSILTAFQKSNADIVGGPTRFADNLSIVQTSIKNCFHSIFGMGDSSVHNIEYTGYTDSVTFGAWKKFIFEKTGLFDENLTCNQDDEFHYRAKTLGFKIYQDSSIKLYYVPRKTLSKLFIQYFRYGYNKPYVLLKNYSEIKIRHIIPALFSLYILLLPVAFILTKWAAIPLAVYTLFSAFFSFKDSSSPLVSVMSIPVFFTIHFSYGIGSILGFINLGIKRRKKE